MLRKTLGIEAYAVPRAEQRNVLGTEFYHGGMVRNDIGGLHPAKLHRGMLRAGREAGAIVHCRDGGARLRRRNGGFEVETARGRVQADHVIVGTNGYTDGVDPLAAPPAGAGAQPHHRHRAALQQPDGRADAEARHVRGDAQAALLLPALARRHAHPVRRPRRHHRRRAHLADRQPAPRAGRYLSRARRRRHHAQLVWPCRHEPRHDPARLLAPRHALRRRLLRLGRGVGALGRTEGGMAGAGRRARPLRARLPPAADHPALQRQALVPAGRLRLDDAARPARPSAAASDGSRRCLQLRGRVSLPRMAWLSVSKSGACPVSAWSRRPACRRRRRSSPGARTASSRGGGSAGRAPAASAESGGS